MVPRIDQLPVQEYSDSARQQKEDEPQSPVDSMEEEEGGDSLPSLPKPLKLRPETPRSSTEPSPSVLLQAHFSSTASARPSSSHRNRSPYSRSHLRSRSSGAALAAPPMTRAHSLPSVRTARTSESTTPSTGSLSPSPGTASPMRSPARVPSPFKAAAVQAENIYLPPPRSPNWLDVTHGPTSGNAIQSIQEDSELDLTPRQPIQPVPLHASFSRSNSLRRRPASPLHSVANAAPTSFPASVIDNNTPLNMSTASSGFNSPALGPQKYNESYPSPSMSLHHYASTSSFNSVAYSSMPSTPTSARSRSPSISSLETIEDAPDAESAAEIDAREAERIMRLKLAADRADRMERGEDVDEPRRRSSLDVPRGFGFGRGGNRERKRWSICGGERRGDLDLETIWED